VVTTLLVDSNVGIVDYWSAKEWREFCHPSRANEAPPAWQPAQQGIASPVAIFVRPRKPNFPTKISDCTDVM